MDAWPWKAQRGPVAEDLWHTGTTQIVFPVSAYGSGTVGGAIQVYDTGSPHRALWPHPEYVSAPANGTPPPPPPPTNFSATFKLGNVNEWWVETTVTANRAITGVAAQVDDGAWMNLTLQSWGAWARSFYVPNGSRVIFRATDPNGGQSLSSTFCWLQPSCGGTPPPPPPPPPGNFTASFKLGNVNNWWVETYASSAHTVVGVDARTNGGAWIPLAKQSWGSWAKSFRVESGATVEFRAHNGTDALAVSNGFVWP